MKVLNKIQITDEQRDVIDRTVDCVLNKKEAVFISGPAGSGKTFSTDIIAETLINKGKNVIFTASTHTAANKLNKSISDRNKKLEVTTIHSFLKMKLERIQYGKQIFTFPEDFIFPEDSILVIDESSMLSHDMYSFIEQNCFPNVIFLGDSVQIPPVTENDDERTRFLTEDDSEPPIVKVKNKFELFKIHRQTANSSLSKLCKILRDEILNGNGAKLYDDKERLIDILYNLEQEDDNSIFLGIPQNQVVPAILGNEDTSFLAFGNATTNAVQKHLPEWYVEGGHAILNGSVTRECDGKHLIMLHNNQHIQINKIQKKVLKKWNCNFDLITCNDVEFYCPSNQDIFDAQYDEWVQAALYNDVGKKMSDELDKKYYIYGYAGITNTTLNDFCAGVCTMREGRVSTVHRAQGDQWKNVIIAFDNILFAGKNLSDSKKNDVHRKIIAMKLFYTAISRAREKLIVCFGTNNSRYTPE
jgi:energy-coupling factor transporter ATP-binding protein EcfA2